MVNKKVLLKKRRQLHDIKNALMSFEREHLSPCMIFAIFSALFVSFLIGPVFKIGVLFSLATGIAVGFLSYSFLKIPRSWADVLDKRLAEYDPIDTIAYARLHSLTKQHGGFCVQDVYQWIDTEFDALYICVPADARQTATLFINKHIPANSFSLNKENHNK